MDDSVEDLADPFIDLANGMAADGKEPDVVVSGFVYAAARYSAFVALNRPEQQGRTEAIAALRHMFSEALDRHLVQLSSDEPQEPDEPATAHAAAAVNISPDNPADERFYELAQRMARASEGIDLVVVGYLRGKGDHALADELTMGIADLKNDDPDVTYARRLYAAMERGALPQSLAYCAIQTVLMDRMIRMSPEGYVRDPVLSDDARRRHAEFYASFQLHKLATTLRKDVAKFMALAEEGQEALMGPQAAEARKLMYERRRRIAH